MCSVEEETLGPTWEKIRIYAGTHRAPDGQLLDSFDHWHYLKEYIVQTYPELADESQSNSMNELQGPVLDAMRSFIDAQFKLNDALAKMDNLSKVGFELFNMMEDIYATQEISSR